MILLQRWHSTYIWVVDNDEAINSITEIFAKKVPATYIADGHHRAASAAKVSKELARKCRSSTIFPDDNFSCQRIAIWDYNRVVKDLNGMDAEDLIRHCRMILI